jgi:hypothetical protein
MGLPTEHHLSVLSITPVCHRRVDGQKELGSKREAGDRKRRKVECRLLSNTTRFLSSFTWALEEPSVAAFCRFVRHWYSRLESVLICKLMIAEIAPIHPLHLQRTF